MNRHVVPDSQLQKPLPTREQYDEAFLLERSQIYPVPDELEQQTGHALDKYRLESAARVLACPVKMRPPCWQHGRVVYSILRQYLQRQQQMQRIFCLDIGTAKGFSALCATWALIDDPRAHVALWDVVSLDVLPVDQPTRRNSVMETDGPLRLSQYLEAWPEASCVRFLQSSGSEWLSRTTQRVHFAFLDGKHRRDHVSAELGHLARVQKPGDVVVLDDLQIPGVVAAVGDHSGEYDVTRVLDIRDDRRMAVAVRLGGS